MVQFVKLDPKLLNGSPTFVNTLQAWVECLHSCAQKGFTKRTHAWRVALLPLDANCTYHHQMLVTAVGTLETVDDKVKKCTNFRRDFLEIL